jgi:hypothetical protein
MPASHVTAGSTPTSSAVLSALLTELHTEFPAFKLVPKTSSYFMKLLDVLLRAITFGQARGFMTNFITTIGYTVYVNKGWDSSSEVGKAIVLRHERVHMRQRRKYGSILFSLMYLLLPLPCLFAYFRRQFEMEAYAETLLAIVELNPGGIAGLQTYGHREYVVSFFTGSSYFWTWPFRKQVEAWYDASLKKALASAQSPV